MSEENPVKLELTCPNGHRFWENDWVVKRLVDIKKQHGQNGLLCPECRAPMKHGRPWESKCVTISDEERVILSS